MPHLHTHATFYSICRLVVPLGIKAQRDQTFADVLFWISSDSVYWAKRCLLARRNDPFRENSHLLSFKILETGNPSSNVYQAFLSAVIRTLNPIRKVIGAMISDSVHVCLKITISRLMNTELPWRFSLHRNKPASIFVKTSGKIFKKPYLYVLDPLSK